MLDSPPCSCLALWRPKPDSALQVQSLKCHGEAKNHFSQLAALTLDSHQELGSADPSPFLFTWPLPVLVLVCGYLWTRSHPIHFGLFSVHINNRYQVLFTPINADCSLFLQGISLSEKHNMKCDRAWDAKEYTYVTRWFMKKKSEKYQHLFPLDKFPFIKASLFWEQLAAKRNRGWSRLLTSERKENFVSDFNGSKSTDPLPNHTVNRE